MIIEDLNVDWDSYSCYTTQFNILKIDNLVTKNNNKKIVERCRKMLGVTVGTCKLTPWWWMWKAQHRTFLPASSRWEAGTVVVNWISLCSIM